jgi:histone demethylase JARID1
METSLFSPPRFGREPQFASSSPRQNLDDVFADLTNQEDADPEGQSMENTHANEALEALVADNGSSRAGSVPEEPIQTGDHDIKHEGVNEALDDSEL